MKSFLILSLCMPFLCICCTQKIGNTVSIQKEKATQNLMYPELFSNVFEKTKKSVAKTIADGVTIPIPKDMGGGYTHEKHKQNYRDLQDAGFLYNLTKETQYAEYIKEMFYGYSAIFKSLPIHPTDRSYATGKIFWQCLNDANWMVYGSQAYEAIYDYLTKEERTHIENEFLRPYADFISLETPQFFNRVHNHSTWGNAAVGMVGLAIKDDALVQRALYGLDLKDIDNLAKDNDGGFVFEKGKVKAGFFAQIDYAFSPDGYYEEGPYYQRYAMLPFMVFANALNKQRPDIKIFEYRDGILVKAVKALLNQTNQSGEFFPINDAQKGMSIHPNSVVTAVNVAYGASKDLFFVEAARLQNTVLLDENGLALAEKVASTISKPLQKKSLRLSDGANGDAGALFVLRAGNDDNQTTAVFKCTSQGLGHGHYDKLGYLLYDGDTEVLQDYGAARWVNIDQKAGGRYLPENKTWAKQTVAHNTLVVDKKSHFNGKYELANKNHSDPLFFNVDNSKVQSARAKEVNAYSDVVMDRVIILWEDDYFDNPILIDYFSASSETEHLYDMPYHYAGQIMGQNFEYKINVPFVLGDGHGYQHIYQEASGTTDDQLQMNWFKDNKFYTMTSTAESGDSILLARIGANDPSFNLRRDPLLIHRKQNVKNATFLTLIENHGTYSPVTEVPLQPYSKIASVNLVEDNDIKLTISIMAKDGKKWKLQMDKITGSMQINNK